MAEVVESMGYTVFSDNLEKVLLEKGVAKTLNTMSPNSYGIATKDAAFDKALKASDYLVLDGVYFALSTLLMKGKNMKKNQGPEIFYHFMERVQKESGRVFFLGASVETLEKMKSRAAQDYPDVEIGYHSPPYKPEFTDEENQEMLDLVNDFEPDILFVGMTCPKQEKWSDQHKGVLKTSLICSIGAVFDWYAGNQKEIAPIWWKLRLAWLIRTINRPEILRRYPNVGIFVRHMFLFWVGLKKA